MIAALGAFWAPAMALLSDVVGERRASTRRSRSRSPTSPGRSGTWWAARAGGALADATADALALRRCSGVACALTLAGVIALGRRAPAQSPAARRYGQFGQGAVPARR